MAKTHAKAHVYYEGDGGLVTGTDDIELARTLMRDELLTVYTPEEMIDYDFTASTPEVQVGRIVPAPRGSEYAWFWKSLPESEKGKRGVTRGVVWNQ